MNVSNAEFEIKAKILNSRLIQRFGSYQVNIVRLLLQNPTFIAMTRVQPMFTLEHYLSRYFSVSVKPANSTYVGFYVKNDGEEEKVSAVFKDDIFRSGAFVVNELLREKFVKDGDFKSIARDGLCQTVVPADNMRRELEIRKQCEVVPEDFLKVCKSNEIELDMTVDGDEKLETIFAALVQLRRKEAEGVLKNDGGGPPTYDEDVCDMVAVTRAGDHSEFPFWFKLKQTAPSEELRKKIESKGAMISKQGDLWCAYIPTSAFKSLGGGDVPEIILDSIAKAVRRADVARGGHEEESGVQLPEATGEFNVRLYNGFNADLNVGANKHLVNPAGEAGEIVRNFSSGQSARWWKVVIPADESVEVGEVLKKSKDQLESFIGESYSPEVYETVTLTLILKRKGNLVLDRKAGLLKRKQ